MNNLVMLTSYLMLPRQFVQYFFNLELEGALKEN